MSPDYSPAVMSPHYSPMSPNNMPPPSKVPGVVIIIGIILIFIILVLIGVISCLSCYARKFRKALVKDIIRATLATPTVQPPTPTVKPPTLTVKPPTSTVKLPSNAFQAWEVDAPTMERFLRDFAQQKPVRFTAQQLCSFTSNYSIILGLGGFGKVYKGKFPNGDEIAIKVLNRSANSSVEQQFMAEVGTIGKTHHINLVRLYGFCYDPYMSALVYEYMENGSLDKYLFGDQNKEIEWERQHEIAIGTAKGLSYLHEECQQRIIHYDIKPGNVLLDSNFSPKVADFGLAKLCNRDATHITVTGYRGTPGYVAPEFMLKNFPITYKCDVYSFGILLFEIVGRRKNLKVGSTESIDSLDWFPKKVWEEYEKGKLMALTKACGIEEKYRPMAENMSMVALWCIQDSPDARPPMSSVVKMLEGGVEIMPPPKPFHYLFSIRGVHGMRPPNDTWSDSTYSMSTSGTNHYWYKEETTPIMKRYEIEMVSS